VKLGAAILALAVTSASGAEWKQRSDSSTRQFTVWCDDTPVRQRIASFAEEVKSGLAQLLGEANDGTRWQTPIVITVARASTLERHAPPVEVRPVQSVFGFKIDIHVRVGDDPAAVHLEKQIVRALLLGYAYGSRGLERGDTFVEAPWWVIEGALRIFRRRELGVDTALFQRLIASGLLPPIAEFLAGKPADLGPAALAMDHACAMALVELLVEQPGGRDSLARLIREWPHGNREPVTALTSAFPSLASEQSLQRWWTLSIARLAASDRYEGLSLAETDRELSANLTIVLPADRDGRRRGFQLREYRAFLKLKGSREALLVRQSALVALSARANALLRPVIGEYERIVALLAGGKTRGLDARLAQVTTAREQALLRLSQIEDYLNWFEATQLGTRSDAFDSFLKTANEIAEQEQRGSDQITRYLDQLEREL
jgi:hypothetical protein